jgi:hypothetical protein
MSTYDKHSAHKMRESLINLEHEMKKIENNILYREEQLEDAEKTLEYNKKHNYDNVYYYNSIRIQTIDIQMERLKRDRMKIEIENMEESLQRVSNQKK